jgi:hypothetical protein
MVAPVVALSQQIVCSTNIQKGQKSTQILDTGNIGIVEIIAKLCKM